MKILASSIQRQLEGFLHPGYISGLPDPHGLSAAAYGSEPPTLQLEMGEALALKGQGAAEAAVGVDGGSGALAGVARGASTLLGEGAELVGTAVGTAHELWLAAATLCCCGLIAAAHVLRTGSGGRRQGLAVAALVLMATVGVSVVALASRPPPRAAREHAHVHATQSSPATPSPATVDARSSAGPYRDPHAATQAVLHGILADALVNHAVMVRSLGDLRDQVALPTRTPTKGQQHALAHYHLDGWGRPFRFQVSGDWAPYRYLVTSAGADGRFETGDDMTLAIAQGTPWTWSAERHAYFVTRDREGYAVAFRCPPNRSFAHRNAARAKAITGSLRFDVLSEQELSRAQLDRVRAVHAAATSRQAHDPLVLQVVPTPTAGTNTRYHYASMRGYWRRPPLLFER